MVGALSNRQRDAVVDWMRSCKMVARDLDKRGRGTITGLTR